eukprot:GO256255.1.p1 GENE.GO256255.1~~GO256255.1.p1  ORF type:complete len:154 (+),score=0.80 GO256255.1:99-560(+)
MSIYSSLPLVALLMATVLVTSFATPSTHTKFEDQSLSSDETITNLIDLPNTHRLVKEATQVNGKNVYMVDYGEKNTFFKHLWDASKTWGLYDGSTLVKTYSEWASDQWSAYLRNGNEYVQLDMHTKKVTFTKNGVRTPIRFNKLKLSMASDRI